MNKKQWQERQDTINCFISEAQHVGSMCTPADVEQFCDRLHRYETTLHRINEMMCNEDITEQTEKQKESIRQKVRDIADLLKFKVRFNQDPRGRSIRFVLPSGRSNGWDNETWGIYW